MNTFIMLPRDGLSDSDQLTRRWSHYMCVIHYTQTDSYMQHSHTSLQNYHGMHVVIHSSIILTSFVLDCFGTMKLLCSLTEVLDEISQMLYFMMYSPTNQTPILL